MEVVVKNQALESLFEECAKEFWSVCPRLAKTLADHTRDKSNLLHNQNGMSKDGNMMLLACMPQFIYPFIRRQAQKRLGIDDVWRDPRNFRLFLRVWKTCNVKRTPKLGLLTSRLAL